MLHHCLRDFVAPHLHQESSYRTMSSPEFFCYKIVILKAIKSSKNLRGLSLTEIRSEVSRNVPLPWDENAFQEAFRAVECEWSLVNNESYYSIPVAQDTSKEDGFGLAPSKQTFENMVDLWRNEQLCDAEIVSSDGQVFKAHRLVLISASDYMKALLAEDRFKDSADCPINLPDVSSRAVKSILEWMYGCGTRIKSTSDGIELLEAASMLQCNALMEQVDSSLHDSINGKNCIEIWSLGDRLHLDKLVKKSREVAAANFSKLVQSENFVNMEFDHLLSLIKEDGIQVKSEQFVYKATLKWSKTNLERGSCSIEEIEHLFATVRFALIEKKWLNKQLVDEALFIENPRIYRVIVGGLTTTFLPRNCMRKPLKARDMKVGMKVKVTNDPEELKRKLERCWNDHNQQTAHLLGKQGVVIGWEGLPSLCCSVRIPSQGFLGLEYRIPIEALYHV